MKHRVPERQTSLTWTVKPMHKCPTSEWNCLHLIDVPDPWNHQIKGLVLQRKGSGLGICGLGYESQLIKWEQLRELYTVIWGQLSGELGSLFQDLLMPLCDQRNHEIEGVDSVETFLKGQTKKIWQENFKNHWELFGGWLFFLFSCHWTHKVWAVTSRREWFGKNSAMSSDKKRETKKKRFNSGKGGHLNFVHTPVCKGNIGLRHEF